MEYPISASSSNDGKSKEKIVRDLRVKILKPKQKQTKSTEIKIDKIKMNQKKMARKISVISTKKISRYLILCRKNSIKTKNTNVFSKSCGRLE